MSDLSQKGRGPAYGALTYSRAVEIQNALRARLIFKPPSRPVHLVGGADVGFADRNETAIAGIVLFSWPGLDVVDVAVAKSPTAFPYIPGLLSFREIPPLLAAFSRLSARPDLLFCDGQGLAHPRRLGLACHLGLILDMPTIGCAKSVLVGKFEEPASKRGSRSAMTDQAETVGTALRTRDNVRPLYVSPGHLMDIDTAVRFVLAAGRGYRLPEPTRHAHNLVARAKAARG